jgi:hypothetical protein
VHVEASNGFPGLDHSSVQRFDGVCHTRHHFPQRMPDMRAHRHAVDLGQLLVDAQKSQIAVH